MVPASAEVAVAEAEEALEHALLLGVEPGLHHGPRIVRHQLLHEDEDYDRSVRRCAQPGLVLAR